MSKQAVSGVLRHLEACGCLRLEPDPRAGRGRVVRLTDEERALQEAVHAAGRQVEREWRDDVRED